MNSLGGYPSNDPCYVCGKFKNNEAEPRFDYTVCEDHAYVQPAYLGVHKIAYLALTRHQ